MRSTTGANDSRNTLGTTLADIQAELSAVRQQLVEIQADVQYIKAVFVREEESRLAQQLKEEQAQRALETERTAREIRYRYEDIVWRLRDNRTVKLIPPVPCKISARELEIVSLMARKYSDADIAVRLNLKENSISPRICAMNKTLGLSDRQQLVDFYTQHVAIVRAQRQQHCKTLLRWLLNPPPGFIRYPNFELRWQRKLGKGRDFCHVGDYIPRRVLDSLRPFEHRLLSLVLKGQNDESIASKLKIKATTIKTYLADIRSTVKMMTGSAVSTDTLLVNYKHYLQNSRAKSHRGRLIE